MLVPRFRVSCASMREYIGSNRERRGTGGSKSGLRQTPGDGLD